MRYDEPGVPLDREMALQVAEISLGWARERIAAAPAQSGAEETTADRDSA